MKKNKCKYCQSRDLEKRWLSKTECYSCYQKRYIDTNALKRICLTCSATSSKGSWYKGPKCSKCYFKGEYKSRPERILKQKWHHLIAMSKRRNSVLDLTESEYLKIINDGCFYCQRNLTKLTGHSLDKIDSDSGYVKTNILPCCGDCNTIRMNLLTVKETQEVVNLIKRLRKTENCPWLLDTRMEETE